MFESLQDGLRAAFKTISGKSKLTESNMRDGLKLVEKSLLEADVSIQVVKDFMAAVSHQALGERVLLSLRPQEQLVGIVNQELIKILGPVDHSLPLKDDVNVIMMCGLQGSGKTTTCGKLAALLLKSNVPTLLVAADLQRPAAIEQLHVIGRQIGVPVYSEPGATDPVAVCRNAMAQARKDNIRLVILDTAGRLAIDRELMEQLKTIDREIKPQQVFLVVDGMTGQDAVNSAKAFHDALELNGVIMTKLDGDARGGALLSVKHVTGVPIKFIGTGEHLDALEVFRPDGMASRILGMGDVVALVEQAQRLVDEKEQLRIQEQLEKGQFTFDDFRDHMARLAKPGLMQKMLSLLPGMGAMREMQEALNNEDSVKQIRQMVGIIDAMTADERRNPRLLDVNRKQRIARGAGVQPKQVNELVKQFEMMKPVFTGMAGKKSPAEQAKMLEEVQRQMVDPSRGMPNTKKSTGKRLTNKEREKLRKQRDKMLRQLRKKGNN
ncbi:MAG TPA: signal recognition particle protein [Pirellulaceae bacterium]|nr:signal recognition particle protein [Pirellulaceae bacterium]